MLNGENWKKGGKNIEEGIEIQRKYLASIKSKAEDKIPGEIVRAERLLGTHKD